jgi:pyridoxal phosphate enzyme (YggS family)
VSSPAPIEANLAALRARIAAACARSGREPASVELIGASKRVAAPDVARAVRAGLRSVGENYVQEARDKHEQVRVELAPEPPPRWHLIGRLQRNKVALALRCFDVIETLDSEALGDELNARASALGQRIEALIQVNLSGETQKAGIAPELVPALLERSLAWPGVGISGLMTLPAAAPDAESSRPAFRALRELRDALRRKPGGRDLQHLSMGMSGDFEVAIEEGADFVRIGTALFGARTTA